MSGISTQHKRLLSWTRPKTGPVGKHGPYKPELKLIFLVSEPNLKLRSRLKQKQERRNSPLMARKSPGNEVLTERIRRKISTNSIGEKNEMSMIYQILKIVEILKNLKITPKTFSRLKAFGIHCSLTCMYRNVN